MNRLTSNQVFLDSVAHLMSFHQNNLTQKALELVLAKLEGLTEKCPPATVILTFASETVKHPPRLEATLENGLCHIFNQILSAMTSSPCFFSFDKAQTKLIHLRLSCLRRLAQLLCSLHSDKLLKVHYFLTNQLANGLFYACVNFVYFSRRVWMAFSEVV